MRPPNGSTSNPIRLQRVLVSFDRVQFLVGEFERDGEEQPLTDQLAPSEARHDPFIQHPLVGRMLVHEDHPFGALINEIGVEDLDDFPGSA